MQMTAFELHPVPPFRLDFTVWILRRRPDNVIDRWDGERYQRVLLIDGLPIEVTVRQLGTRDTPRLAIELRADRLPAGARERVTDLLDRMLGIQVDLSDFYTLAASDPHLARLVEPFRGAKPTRYPDLFEALVNAIACQQVTLSLGIRMLNRLTQAYGLHLSGEGAAAPAFPRPRDLACAHTDDLRALGFSRQKAEAVVMLAQAVEAGTLRLDELERLDDSAVCAQLCRLRGVGRWTAEYGLLRGLGRLHVFPGDDAGGQRNVRRWLGIDGSLTYDQVREVLAPWHAFAGLVYYHLLLSGLAERGFL